MLSNYTEWQCNEPYNRVPTVFRETANADVTCVITKTTDINLPKIAAHAQNCRIKCGPKFELKVRADLLER